MNEKEVKALQVEEKEICSIFDLLKKKGYQFSERQKGRIEQMLIDAKSNTPATT